MRKEMVWGYDKVCVSCILGKVSVSAFSKDTCSGSVTVEAVLCIPLFLYAAISLIWMLEIRAIQISVRCALHEAGKELTVELAELPLLNAGSLERKVSEFIGEERISRSLITGEIQCDGSFIWPTTGVMELIAHYQVKLPVPFFTIPTQKYEESMRMKAWNGYVKNGFGEIFNNNEKIVYVTDTGIVYHCDYHCSYLEPSIRSVASSVIEEQRNAGGEKYYPCLLCGWKVKDSYYITSYGNKYHGSLSCSGLKRNVYAVPISEAKGKGACSKCGQ